MEKINISDYDPFYFSRSDLSDEMKMQILNAKLEQGLEDIKAGKGKPVDQVCDEIIAEIQRKYKVA